MIVHLLALRVGAEAVLASLGPLLRADLGPILSLGVKIGQGVMRAMIEGLVPEAVFLAPHTLTPNHPHVLLPLNAAKGYPSSRAENIETDLSYSFWLESFCGHETLHLFSGESISILLLSGLLLW